MRRKRSLAGLALAVLAVLAGSPAAQAAAPEATVDRVSIESFDGVELGGWLIRPGDASARKLPTVLISTPYIGQCIGAGANGPCWPAPETPEDWAQHPEPVELLVKNGYAVALFSVRGTGVSGGCFDDLGPREQRDQRELVNWIAAQPWSNERVGMMGLSYMSQTALSGAVMHPRALKTVVVSGINADLYTFFHSPQGLPYFYGVVPTEATYAGDISFTPPGTFGGDPALVAGRLQHHHERACPEVLRTITESSKGATTGDRDAQFWLDRRLTSRYQRVEASVLVAQGLLDLWGSGHAMQEDTIWSQIRAPKAMYIGQWGHTWPWQTGPAQAPPREDLREEWFTTLLSWLDHYLKGGPKPDILGRVRYEEEGGRWHQSDRWPPRESQDEALYLAPGEQLSPQPAARESSVSFVAYPQLDRATATEGFMCPAWLDTVHGPGGQVFMTAPVQKRTVLAGNPMAYLDLAADQPGGGFQVTLFDIAPEFNCAADPARRQPAGVRKLTIGGADLRFHHGGFDARPFSTGHVRVDLANIAAVLEPGHRLAVAVSYGDPIEFTEVGHTPRITVRSGPRTDASRLVVPVLEGGFGGRPPSSSPSPRALKAAEFVSLPSARKCVSRRKFRIRLKRPAGAKFLSAVVKVNGRKVKTLKGKSRTARVDLRGLPKGRFTVVVEVVTSGGRKVKTTRRYRTCAPKRKQ